MGGDLGVRLRQLLQQSTALKELNCIHTFVESSCATLLFEGLCQNHSLTTLHFQDSEIDVGPVTDIVECLFVNQNVTFLGFLGLFTMDEHLHMFFAQIPHIGK